MPHDIFCLSQTYMSSLRKRKSNDIVAICKRRRIIVAFLSDTYVCQRGVMTMILNALMENDLNVSKSVVMNDIIMYRTAYRYYNEDFRTASNGRREKPLKCLLLDGFATWDDIMNACDGYDWEQYDEMSREEDVQESHDSYSFSPDHDRIAHKMHEVVITGAETLQEVAKIFVKYHSAFTEREQQLQHIVEEHALQAVQIRDHKHVLAEAEKISAQLQGENARLQNDITLLQERLSCSLRENLSLKKRVSDMRAGYLLMKEVYDEDGENNESDTRCECDKMDEVISYADSTLSENLSLPVFSIFYQRQILYSSKFIKAFGELTKNYRNLVLRAMELLSQQGADYPGLRTCKHAETNSKKKIVRAGDFKSRAGRQYRFPWTISENAILIHDLFHKNVV